jgi:hypothetical protein
MELDEFRPMAIGPLTIESLKEAVRWFKNFKPRKDSYRDFIENIPIRLPENPAQKVWNKLHDYSEKTTFTDVDYWTSELNKCLDSEEYFYNNYCFINGKRPTPVPDGYFSLLRTIKARRNPSRYLPIVNTEKKVRKALDYYMMEMFGVKPKEFINITTTSNTA